VFKNTISMQKYRCSVFNPNQSKTQSAVFNRIAITAVLLMTGPLILCTEASAQVKLKSSNMHSGRLHSGRITRSFTEPVEQSVAASAEAGIVAEASVKEGDIVRVGDPLATLNRAALIESLEIAKARAESTARLDAARSQLEMLTSQVEAVQSLVSGGHTSRFEVEQKQAEYHTNYAEYHAALDELKLNKLEVDRIQAQVDDRVIKSPINGVVTEIHKQLGENLSSNEPQYATVVRVDELKVRFYLDAATLKQLRVGRKVKVLVGQDQEPNSAVVTYVSPIIDPDSGLGRIDVKIDNRDLRIQSGIICFWSDDHMLPTHAKLPSGPKEISLQR